MKLPLPIAALLLAAVPATAQAGELFGGVFVHGVDTPFTLGGDPEDGVDFQLGWRGGRIAGTPIQPYLFGSLNSAGATSYAAAGLSAKFGKSVYVRPAVGLAVHNGSDANFDNPFNDEIEFGSRVLIAPEVAIGAQIAPRISAEASWVHLSHATLFSNQNPGLDTFGVRVNVALP